MTTKEEYKKALNTIGDTLNYYMVGKDLASLHSVNEIGDSMATLRELVDKADSFDEASASERLSEKKYESTLFAEAVAHCDKIVINGKVVKGR